MQATGLSLRTVQAQIAALIQAGIITADPDGRAGIPLKVRVGRCAGWASNLYWLLDPGELGLERHAQPADLRLTPSASLGWILTLQGIQEPAQPQMDLQPDTAEEPQHEPHLSWLEIPELDDLPAMPEDILPDKPSAEDRYVDLGDEAAVHVWLSAQGVPEEDHDEILDAAEEEFEAARERLERQGRHVSDGLKVRIIRDVVQRYQRGARGADLVDIRQGRVYVPRQPAEARRGRVKHPAIQRLYPDRKQVLDNIRAYIARRAAERKMA